MKMEEYSVKLAGQNLDIEKLICLLPKLSITLIWPKGEQFSLQNGKQYKNHSGIPNSTNIVMFESTFREFFEFLLYIESNYVAMTDLGVSDIEVWALMFRSGQINGELSTREVKLLAAIDASYCWSAVVEDE